MRSLLKSLFLTTDRAGPLMDSVGKGVNAIVNTAEERQNLLLAWVAATGPTNVARRLLAFVVAGVWTLYQLVLLVLLILSIWFAPLLTTVALIKDHMDRSINGAFMLAMAFYFAPHAIAALKGTAVFQMLGSNKS